MAHEPIQNRIALHYRTLILNGTYPLGSRLPAKPVVAEEFGCSAATVRNAWRQLRQQSLIKAVPGAGGGIEVIQLPAGYSRNVEAEIDRLRERVDRLEEALQAMARVSGIGEAGGQGRLRPVR